MFTPQQLISPKYVVQQRILHGQPQGYGTHGHKWAETVRALIADPIYRISSVLDYGCGQGSLKRAVMADPPTSVRFAEYDPAIAEKQTLPDFADLVVVTDVLEHIEPDRLENVLAHVRMLARRAVLVVVALVADSGRQLSDGRNAHLIVRPANWWKKRMLAAGFGVHRAPAVARKKKSHEWVAVLTP